MQHRHNTEKTLEYIVEAMIMYMENMRWVANWDAVALNNN